MKIFTRLHKIPNTLHDVEELFYGELKKATKRYIVDFQKLLPPKYKIRKIIPYKNKNLAINELWVFADDERGVRMWSIDLTRDKIAVQKVVNLHQI